MKTVKQHSKYFLLALLFSITSNNATADPHQHEKVFAANATKHELADAYLSKCAENHYLAQNLEEAKKDSYTFKTLVKSFGIGAVSGLAVSLIMCIAAQ